MSSYVAVELRRIVYEKSKACCEYCHLHEEDAFFSHEVDHIISEKHRGETIENNLSFSCFECNRYKGSDMGSLDIDSDNFTRLFNPRKDDCSDHFRLRDNEIVPLTAIGRVSVFLLQMNSDDQLSKRDTLIPLNRYPCTI